MVSAACLSACGGGDDDDSDADRSVDDCVSVDDDIVCPPGVDGGEALDTLWSRMDQTTRDQFCAQVEVAGSAAVFLDISAGMDIVTRDDWDDFIDDKC